MSHLTLAHLMVDVESERHRRYRLMLMVVVSLYDFLEGEKLGGFSKKMRPKCFAGQLLPETVIFGTEPVVRRFVMVGAVTRL